MQTYLILFIAVITAVISQLLFKKGVGSLNLTNISIAHALELIVSILKNPYIVTGLFFYGISFVIWLVVLSRMKLSVAYPITSMNFVFVLFASYYLFGEKISITQLGGISLIIIGVIALAKT